jgi:GNAT superfamily N-acetyltransferase
MDSLSAEKIQEMTKAHYKLQVGCYLKGTHDLEGAIYSIGKYITDNYWNYASLVRTKSENVARLIERVEKFSKENDRVPAFYLDPFTEPVNLNEMLEQVGFELKDQEIWMLHDDKTAVEEIKDNSNVKMQRVSSTSQMKRYVDMFNVGFGMSSDAYGKSLYESFVNPTTDVEILHYIASIEDKECGVASLYSSGKVGGVYNVTTLPEFRCKGVGTALNKKVIQESLKRNHDLLILQTEEHGDAYRIYERMGFRPGFLARIYHKA